MKRHILAAAALLAAPLAASAAVIQVDSFSDASAGNYPSSLSSVAGPFIAGIDTPIAGTIGGGRLVVFQADAMDIPGLDTVTVRVFPGGPGVFDYSSSAGADGYTYVAYGNYFGLFAPLNLAVPDGSYAKIDLVSFDLPAGGALRCSVQLANSGAGLTEVSPTVLAATAGAQSILIPLDSISAADRANVTNLAVIFDGTTATDYRVDNISLVTPEPASIGLLTAGSLALLRRRRRA